MERIFVGQRRGFEEASHGQSRAIAGIYHHCLWGIMLDFKIKWVITLEGGTKQES